MITITSRVNIAPLERLARGLAGAVAEVNREMADRVKAAAIRNAEPYRDTGAEVAGYYVATRARDGFPLAAAAARARNPKVSIVDAPEPPSDPASALVGNATLHDAVNEYGSAALHRAPRAMLQRAVEEARAPYVAAVEARIRELLGE